jgi:asparagine synthetase B (glutamine-hydrolysing)
MNDSLPSLDYLERPLDSIRDFLTESIDGLIDQLDRSVKLQVNNIPAITKSEAQCDLVYGCICGSKTQGRMAVLFSGGIDSAIIAYLAHK